MLQVDGVVFNEDKISLLSQVRTLEGDCLKQKKELSNVKDQLAKSERLLEEGRNDLINNKQKLKGCCCYFDFPKYSFKILWKV